MKKILFQGDSITDCYRVRDDDNFMGMNYPTFIKGRLGLEQPGKYTFMNRAISGDRVPDIYARIKRELINLRPDILSVLIGVNDVWHELSSNNGTSPEDFETIYSFILTKVKKELPEIKLILIEPFCLKGAATDNTEEQPDRWMNFSTGVYELAKVTKRVAEKFDAVFVPVQDAIDEASKRMDCSTILMDGVHPTAVGHEIITRRWLEYFNKYIAG